MCVAIDLKHLLCYHNDAKQLEFLGPNHSYNESTNHMARKNRRLLAFKIVNPRNYQFLSNSHYGTEKAVVC